MMKNFGGKWSNITQGGGNYIIIKNRSRKGPGEPTGKSGLICKDIVKVADPPSRS